MKKYRLLLPLFFTASGCAPYVPMRLQDDVQHSYESRSLNNQEVLNFITKYSPENNQRKTWDLNKLTLAAFYYSPNLELSRAERDTSTAALTTAENGPNPVFSWLPQFVSNAHGAPTWAQGFNLDLGIETAGKKELRIETATFLESAKKAAILETAWLIRNHIRDALLLVQKAKENIALIKEEQAILKDDSNYKSQKINSGETSSLVVLDTNSLLLKNEFALKDASYQLLEAKLALADAVSVPLAAVNSITLDCSAVEKLEIIPEDFLSYSKEYALKHRSDILTALATYNAADSAYKLELANQYPDLHLSPNYTWDQGAHKWGLSFTGTQNDNAGPILETQSKRKEAAIKFLTLQEQVISDIDSSVILYKSALDKVSVAKNVVSSQDAQNKKIFELLRPGDVTRAIYLRSKLNLISVKNLKLDATFQAATLKGKLESVLEQSIGDNFSIDAKTIENSPKDNTDNSSQVGEQ